MHINRIDSFADFCEEIQKAGFSMGGGNNEGIFSIEKYYSDRIIYHTGDADTDPWEWRIRGITERDNLAYSKLFFKKGGWITKEWYPYFLAIRRKGKSFEEVYYDGLLPILAKEVYSLISERPDISLYEIKNVLTLGNNRKTELDKVINDLQMTMFITISGQKQKISAEGKPYGWPVTTFSTIETFWGQSIMDRSKEIDLETATEMIVKRIMELNENANRKKVKKFLAG